MPTSDEDKPIRSASEDPSPKRIKGIYEQLLAKKPGEGSEPLLPEETLRAQIELVVNSLAPTSGAGSDPAKSLLGELQRLLASLGSKDSPTTLAASVQALRQLIGEGASSREPAGAAVESVRKRLQQLLTQLSGRQQDGSSSPKTLSELLGEMEATVGKSSDAPISAAAGTSAGNSIQERLYELSQTATQLRSDLKTWQEDIKATQTRILSRLGTLENLSPGKERTDSPGLAKANSGGLVMIVLQIIMLTLLSILVVTAWSGTIPKQPVIKDQGTSADLKDAGVTKVDAGSPAATTEHQEHPVIQQCSPMLMCPEQKCNCPTPTIGPIFVQPQSTESPKPVWNAVVPDGGTRARH